MPFFYTDSGSFNNLEVTGSTILSGSLIVSGATNFGPTGLTGSLFGTSSIAQTASFVEFTNIANRPELVSSSGQISYPALSNIPADIVSSAAQVKTFLPTDTVSSSAFTSPSQGTVRATINGVQTDVDTGLQSGDSPSFVGVTVTSATASIVSASTAITASNVQLNNLTDTTSANKVLVLDTTTNRIFTTASVGGGTGTAFPFNGNAIITGSLLISSSGNVTALRSQGDIQIESSSLIITGSNEGVYVRHLPPGGTTQPIAVMTAGNSGTTPLAIFGSDVGTVVIRLEGLGVAQFVSGSGDLRHFSPTAATVRPIDLGFGSDRWRALYVRNIDSTGSISHTGSMAITGSISASSYTSSLNNQVGFLGTSSWAQQAVSASYFSGSASFPDGLTVTSLTASVGISTTTISASAGITGSLAQFNPVSLKLTVGTTAPSSPAVNDLWVDTN